MIDYLCVFFVRDGFQRWPQPIVDKSRDLKGMREKAEDADCMRSCRPPTFEGCDAVSACYWGVRFSRQRSVVS
jgi:hypothetical protein